MEGKLGCAVPTILWDAFEEALQTNIHRLAKDIANTLGQSHQPLLDAIKAKKVKPYLVEMKETGDCDMACEFVCQRPGATGILQPCGQPILWGAEVKRCPQHLHSTEADANLPTVKVLEGVEGVALYTAEDGTVYDGNYELKGRIVGSVLNIFEIE